ncbi:hypothetical protein A0126_18800 (plasmid) [Exiguobacterium sp. N4-1P]|uniref:hypothetical protein n=1 Tax=Exiguobacterium sp. N4-1P TaxID=2051906 RepID=UPI000B5883E5|nr:hypothetical protein [Exiguobacterium sp. N4-1P]ASI36865.1 hypothetical protein A0126_15120 [Exiguobacterium sp. N4-1P]ASI37638.1 hypothetical protein A0126_18800 [Exiguobacterium sp. N4-1P]
MRKQSVRAPRVVRYTELKEQGLVEMLHEGDDLIRLLQERGFICVEGKVTFAPYRLMLELEEERIEYQVKSFGVDDVHVNPHSEFSLPHFIDDRIINVDGFREPRRIKPPNFVPRNIFDMTFSEASAYTPFLTEDNKKGLLQMIRNFGFVGTNHLSYRLVHNLNLRKTEFMMRSYVDHESISYEFQLEGFIDDREDSD